MLIEEWGVASKTIRQALDHLRGEGLIDSRQGVGVFVREQVIPRRVSSDIASASGWPTSLQRQGLRPGGKTTVKRSPCPPEAAEFLGIPPGEEIVIRDRLMRAEGHDPEMIAVSHFPLWVVEQAPNVANPDIGGMPQWLREAFGTIHSEDVITARMPSQEERERLDLPTGTPVLVIKGGTRDDEGRALHYIEVTGAGGRVAFEYRY
jgi:GntR family transcriptional regulator